MSERLTQLQKLLALTPADPFLLYGVALEHKKAGDADKAIDFLRQTLVADQNYCYAYYQLGQVSESIGDVEAARRAYNDGVVAAGRAGDGHAASEIKGALQALNDDFA